MRVRMLITILLLAGCATAEPQWVKGGATDQDLMLALYECEIDARAVRRPIPGGLAGYAGYRLAGGENRSDIERRCMIAHGWRDAASK